MAELAEVLAERAPEIEAFSLADRVLREQYAFEPSWEEPFWEESEEQKGFQQEGSSGEDLDGAVRVQSEGIQPRAPDQVSAKSLQSPHDPGATYRRKNGKEYPRGYVVGVSETCDPSNEVQLITDMQVAPNTTDDGELLKRSLEDQAEWGRRCTCPSGRWRWPGCVRN